MRAKMVLIATVAAALGSWAWWDSMRRIGPDADLRGVLASELHGLIDFEGSGDSRPLPRADRQSLETWHPQPTQIRLSYRNYVLTPTFEQDEEFMRVRGIEIRTAPTALGRSWLDIRPDEPVLEGWQHARLRLRGLRNGGIVPAR